MSKLTTPSVFFFIALACEAKPLIQKYNLKKLSQQHPFDIYSNEKTVVIVTGVGKVAMAGAVAYSMAVFAKTKNSVLINLGIAGHICEPLGALCLADKIKDSENSNKKFYPQLVGNFRLQSMPLTTVSKPDTGYMDDCLYDMEAAAFYEMAIKFSTSELIHCLKIISDNQHQPVGNINAKSVSTWVSQHLTAIDSLVEHLKILRESINEPQAALYQALMDRYHFTVTAQIKLKALLQRWNVVSDNLPLSLDNTQFNSGKQILLWLENKIEQQEFSL